MKLIDALQEEHALIDAVLGSLRAYVDALAEGRANGADGARYLAFLTTFVGQFHHEREEEVLLEALVTQAELPRERGPVFAILQEHAEMEGWLRAMTPLLEQGAPSVEDHARLHALAVRYTRALWRHIDAENSVLYVEGALRLGRHGVHELPDRAMRESEAAAREDAAALLLRYPPIEDAVLARGDGCFMCRAHGETCDGLEAEWWNELEWDEFFER